MPPASPAPGWSSGLVCTERVATRRGVPGRRKRRAGTWRPPALRVLAVVPVPAVLRPGTPDDPPSCNSVRTATCRVPRAESHGAESAKSAPLRLRSRADGGGLPLEGHAEPLPDGAGHAVGEGQQFGRRRPRLG